MLKDKFIIIFTYWLYLLVNTLNDFRTVDSGQWTVGSGQWAVGSGQWTVDS